MSGIEQLLSKGLIERHSAVELTFTWEMRMAPDFSGNPKQYLV